MKIQLDRKQLLAALCTTANQDIRYYLNGVYVEATGVETRLTATNGNVLSTQRRIATDTSDNDITTVDGLVSIVIPSAIIGFVKGAKGLDPWLTSEDGIKWVLHCDGQEFPFMPIQGKFPDYRRVIPQKTTGEAAIYSPELVAMFAKAATILGSKKTVPCVWIKQNGKDAAWVGIKGYPSYSGVIIPMTLFSDIDPKRGPEPEIPSWSYGDLAAEPSPVEDLV